MTIRSVSRTAGRRRLPRIGLGLAAFFSLLATGCGGNRTYVYGTPVTTVTTTPGPFVSFRLNLLSMYATRSDGSVFSLVVPAYAEELDLTKNYDLTELLSATGLPTGTYKSVALNLDYSRALVALDVNGTVTTATLQNNATPPVAPTTGTVTVTFDPAHQLTVAQNAATRLALHFDLEANASVDLSASTPKVTVRPFPVVTPLVDDAQPIRARGFLVVTEHASNDFIVNIRPFQDIASGGFGALKVLVSPTTYFNVNGTVSTGSAGLTALDGLVANSTITMVGTLKDLSGITPSFEATEVYGGESVESNAVDHVRGIVTARSGNTLTVHASSYLTRSTQTQFQGISNNATVKLGPATAVNQDGGSPAPLTLADISVGQQIDAAGAVTIDSTNTLTSIDTTGTYGQVRLTRTPIWGTVTAASAGAATLDLLGLGFAPLPPADFNYAGTGAAAADPASYAVSTGTTDLSASIGSLAKLTGIVRPFGAAPPDFVAASAATGSALPQQLVIQWTAGTKAPFLSVNSGALVPNAAAADVHAVILGPTTVQLASNPQITFAAPSGGNLELAVNTAAGAISLFHEAASLVTQLNTTVNGTNVVHKVVALGQYDAGTKTFTASRFSLVLE